MFFQQSLVFLFLARYHGILFQMALKILFIKLLPKLCSNPDFNRHYQHLYFPPHLYIQYPYLYMSPFVFMCAIFVVSTGNQILFKYRFCMVWIVDMPFPFSWLQFFNSLRPSIIIRANFDRCATRIYTKAVKSLEWPNSTF